MRIRLFHLLTAFSLLLTLKSSAQELLPMGKFLSDSAKIGLPVQYTLSLRHPPEMQVVFPDSGYRFAPFELIHKQYFSTKTDSRGSIDSVVYTLTTFNIDPVQRLQLPVFLVHQRDCTAAYAAVDSVLLTQLIHQSPKFLAPKANIQYVPVRETLDYKFILLVTTISGLTMLVLYLLFGQQIKRQYRLYRLWREHRSFVSSYEKLRRRVRQKKEASAIENTIVLWKEYMQELHEKPYSSYTTKEIIEVIPNPKLADSLQMADRAIYGNAMPDEIYTALRTLQATAENFYKRKRVEVAAKR